MHKSILIADNDIRHIYSLKKLIQSDSHEFTVGNIIHNKEALAKTIQEHSEFAAFIEINVCGPNEIQFLKTIAKTMLIVLMSTHGYFAINAFECGAIDYLIKPVNASRIKITLERLERFLHFESQKASDNSLWLQLSTFNGIKRLRLNDILYLQAEGNYIRVVCKDCCGLLRKPLYLAKKEFGNENFIQIHRQIVVNKEAIDYIVKQKEGGMLTLKWTQNKLRISRKFMPLCLQ